jgi:hypothetical protein
VDGAQMNANELADELEGMGYLDLLSEAATMLRQQQAEIEALKKTNQELAKYKWMYEGLCK